MLRYYVKIEHVNNFKLNVNIMLQTYPKCNQNWMSSFHKWSLDLGTIRGSLGSDGCCFGQIAGLDYLCNPFRERFKKITQQITRYKRLAMQRLQSVHHTEVGYILKREHKKNRPEKRKTLRSRSRLCHKGVLETQIEELLMSIKR